MNMKINYIQNLLLNMSGGLLPEHLSRNEVNLLRSKYGKNWFTKLGYTEPKYRKPKYEKKPRKIICWRRKRRRTQGLDFNK